MNLMKALGVALVVVGSSMAVPAMADPDLEGAIEDGSCPVDPDPGYVIVLGIKVEVPSGTLITDGGKPVDCSKLAEGDRVKVSCTDVTCKTAASIKFDANSAESSLQFSDDFVPVPKVNGACGDPTPVPLSFLLSNGVECRLEATAEVKQDKKKNPLHLAIPSGSATQTDLFKFLACATPGTPGTQEIKCSGYNDPPPSGGTGVIGTTKVEVKK